VIGVEFNQVHHEVIQNNMKALRLDNVDLYQENILEYYKKIENPEEYILFLDPPWGGKRYKQFKHFILKMGKYFIHEFLEDLYQHQYRYIVLKAPLNLNVQLIIQHVSFKNIKIVKHSNMLLLFFFV
jgi:predicted RNA methylase